MYDRPLIRIFSLTQQKKKTKKSIQTNTETMTQATVHTHYFNIISTTNFVCIRTEHIISAHCSLSYDISSDIISSQSSLFFDSFVTLHTHNTHHTTRGLTIQTKLIITRTTKTTSKHPLSFLPSMSLISSPLLLFSFSLFLLHFSSSSSSFLFTVVSATSNGLGIDRICYTGNLGGGGGDFSANSGTHGYSVSR